MITPAYARTMAAYNRWQNGSLYGAADGLSDGSHELAGVDPRRQVLGDADDDRDTRVLGACERDDRRLPFVAERVDECSKLLAIEPIDLG